MKFRGAIKFKDTFRGYEWVKRLSQGWVDDEFEESKWPGLQKAYNEAKCKSAGWAIRGQVKRAEGSDDTQVLP